MKKYVYVILLTLAAAATGYSADGTYTVKPGDTLWGISEKYFKDPYRWIDLWKGSDKISDPHWIYPGQKLKLDMKSEKDVSGTAARASESAAPQIREYVIFTDKAKEVDIVDPSKERVRKFILDLPEISKLSHFSENQLKGLVLSSAQEDMTLGEKGNRFFVNAGELKGLTSDQLFHIVRLDRPIIDEKTGKKHGYLYTKLGIFQIEETFPQSSVGEVVKAYQEILPGDMLLDIDVRDNPEIVFKRSSAFLEGSIIDFQESGFFASERSFVLIDKGIYDGLEKGDVLKIEKQTGAYREKYKEVGKMVVVKTWDNVSAAYIFDSRDVIGKGFRFSSYVEKEN